MANRYRISSETRRLVQYLFADNESGTTPFSATEPWTTYQRHVTGLLLGNLQFDSHHNIIGSRGGTDRDARRRILAWLAGTGTTTRAEALRIRQIFAAEQEAFRIRARTRRREILRNKNNLRSLGTMWISAKVPLKKFNQLLEIFLGADFEERMAMVRGAYGIAQDWRERKLQAWIEMGLGMYSIKWVAY